MRYEIDDIKKSLGERKNSYDKKYNLSAYFITRPISYPMTLLFLNIGWSANMVSLLSYVFAVLASVSLLIDSELNYLICAFMMFAWLILDCVDGNIARVKKSFKKNGEFVDAIGYYIMISFSFIFLGFQTKNLELMMLASILTSTHVLSRLTFQKYLNCGGRENFFDKKESISKIVFYNIYNFSGLGIFLFNGSIAFEVEKIYILTMLLMSFLVLFVSFLGQYNSLDVSK